MKRPYTVWLDQEDADWVCITGGFSNFSLAMRVVINEHKRRTVRRQSGHVKRVNTNKAKRKLTG